LHVGCGASFVFVEAVADETDEEIRDEESSHDNIYDEEKRAELGCSLRVCVYKGP
jgi:hypothetical protein